MTKTSAIEWTDATWNPLRGCSRISEGCRNCYAERFAARMSGAGQAFEGFAAFRNREPRWTGRVELLGDKLDEPVRWRKPRRVFVNSMSDLFHERLGFDQIAAVFGAMAAAPRHTFQVLTKRAERIPAFFEWYEESRNHGRFRIPELIEHAATCAPPGRTADRLYRAANDQAGRDTWPLPNLWLGVSIENQDQADRLRYLRQVPAAVRFVSAEPLLGDLILGVGGMSEPEYAPLRPDPPGGRLHWVIVGGESGPGARPCDVAAVRRLIAECRRAGVAVFVKQLGSKPTTDHRTRPPGESAYWTHLVSGKGGDPEEWPEDLRVREWPT